MEIQIDKEVTVTLKLSVADAIMLKSMVQNSVEGSPADVKAFQERLFGTLPSFQELIEALPSVKRE